MKLIVGSSHGILVSLRRATYPQTHRFRGQKPSLWYKVSEHRKLATSYFEAHQSWDQCRLAYELTAGKCTLALLKSGKEGWLSACTVARLLSGFILASGKSPVSWQARQILLSACCGPARCPGLPSALGDIQLVSVKRRSQCLAAVGTETGWSYMAVESLFKRVFFLFNCYSAIYSAVYKQLYPCFQSLFKNKYY